jgi:predicted small metal-binding protein
MKYMKTLACRDMGMDCDFVAKGMTEEEVLEKTMKHGMEVHKEKMDEMMKTMSEDQIKEMMRKNIKDE